MVRATISGSGLALLALLFLSTTVCPAAAAVSGNLSGTGGPAGTAAASIHSDQIKGAVNGKDGAVLIATAYGLSAYNGSWSTRHVIRGNVSEGLLDDFVTALGYDPSGNLWIGYGGGLQIFNGATYQTIRNQQVLKDLRITAIQRWGDTMWVATGTAGIHRYRNGTWTWYQPMSREGPGFFSADSLALDPAGDALVIATQGEGAWLVPSPDDPVVFRRIDPDPSSPPSPWHVRQDPLGGVYFFDDQEIRKYSLSSGWTPVLTAADLTHRGTEINDIAAAQDGTLYIGTDDGIYLWRDGAVRQRLGRFDGIGTSDIVRWLFADARGRIWFATPGAVGYYPAQDPAGIIPVISLSSPAGVETISAPAATPPPLPPAATAAPTLPDHGVKEPSLLERITAFFADLFRTLSGTA